MEKHDYEDYFEEETAVKDCDSANTHKTRSNMPVIVLLCCILFVGSAILGLQIHQILNQKNNTVDLQEESYNQQWGNNAPDDNFFGSESGDNMQGEGGSILTRRDEGGKVLYSSDGGITWSETPPQNYGGTDITPENPSGGLPEQQGPMVGSGQGEIMTRFQNGRAYYSTDGGKTWSETSPYGN